MAVKFGEAPQPTRQTADILPFPVKNGNHNKPPELETQGATPEAEISGPELEVKRTPEKVSEMTNEELQEQVNTVWKESRNLSSDLAIARNVFEKKSRGLNAETEQHNRIKEQRAQKGKEALTEKLSNEGVNLGEENIDKIAENIMSGKIDMSGDAGKAIEGMMRLHEMDEAYTGGMIKGTPEQKQAFQQGLRTLIENANVEKGIEAGQSKEQQITKEGTEITGQIEENAMMASAFDQGVGDIVKRQQELEQKIAGAKGEERKKLVEQAYPMLLTERQVAAHRADSHKRAAEAFTGKQSLHEKLSSVGITVSDARSALDRVGEGQLTDQERVAMSALLKERSGKDENETKKNQDRLVENLLADEYAKSILEEDEGKKVPILRGIAESTKKILGDLENYKALSEMATKPDRDKLAADEKKLIEDVKKRVNAIKEAERLGQDPHEEQQFRQDLLSSVPARKAELQEKQNTLNGVKVQQDVLESFSGQPLKRTKEKLVDAARAAALFRLKRAPTFTAQEKQLLTTWDSALNQIKTKRPNESDASILKGLFEGDEYKASLALKGMQVIREQAEKEATGRISVEPMSPEEQAKKPPEISEEDVEKAMGDIFSNVG